MKNIFKFFALLLLFGTLSFVVGCQKEVEITSIAVDLSTVDAEILTTELDSKLNKIIINVLKSDDSVEKVNFNKSMISDSDYQKLQAEGTHTVTITYNSYSTTLSLNIKLPKQEDGGNDGGNEDPEKIDYLVMVNDIAGKPLSDFYVTFYEGNKVVDEGYTGNDGIFKLNLLPNKYDVVIEEKERYFLNETMFQTDLLGTAIEVVAQYDYDQVKGVEADKENRYQLGDLMYDFTVVDTDGNELVLYELLEDYKAVVLNFWYTTCSACFYEFPYMVEAYGSTYETSTGETRKYSDDVAIVGINPGFAGDGDTMDEIRDFKKTQGLNFFVAMDYDFDTSNLTIDAALTTMFGITGYPTTVVIDSYGLIANVEVGSITSADKWKSTFNKYIQEDYAPVFTGEVADDDFVKPDIKQEDSSVLEEAVNGTNHDGTKFNGKYSPEDNKDAEYSWPWIVEEFKGKKTIKPSNQDQNPSFSIVYTTVHLKEGEVFTFDYFSSTEEYDALYVVVNDSIATQISGMSPDWETSYAYVAIEEGDYEIGFCYYKDSSYSSGEDAVYVTNIRILTTDDIDKTTYIYREAAYGQINEFTMAYSKYVTVYYNEEDGYYHVNDVAGPLLFADMLSATSWNNSTIYEISLEGKCIGADGVDYNALIEEYAVYASNSEIGYTPVTKELADALKEIVKALGDPKAKNNINQWLELCVYYSAYGTNGVELALPTVGVCPFEPIMLDGDGIEVPAIAEATFDRIILPRGFIFGFTPTKSGVYKFYTTENEMETMGWACDSEANVIYGHEEGLRIFSEKSTNNEAADNNFVVYAYLEEGVTYLFRAAFYDVYAYTTIHVAMSYVDEKVELLTVASPGFFTSSDDEMMDIISGNFVDVELGEDGFYKVKDSFATDTYLYCDFKYINNITGYPLELCLSEKFNAFDFSKDEYGKHIRDEEGYYRFTGYDEEDNLIQYYVCQDEAGEFYYVKEIGEGEYTEANGYKYIKLSDDDMKAMKAFDYTETVKSYLAANLITDETSELYGCVKVNEEFAEILGLLMDKYTFAGIEESWVKLCYYYKYVGEENNK